MVGACQEFVNGIREIAEVLRNSSLEYQNLSDSDIKSIVGSVWEKLNRE